MAEVSAMSDDELRAVMSGNKPLANWSDEELQRVASGAKQPTLGERAIDLPKQMGIGLGEAGIGLAGMPGDVQALVRAGINKISPTAGALPQSPGATIFPTSHDITSKVQEWTGPFPEPIAPEGRFGRAVGQFAPAAAIGPGGLGRRLVGQVLAPALTSETAREAAQGTGYEGAAGIGGALLGAGFGIPGYNALANRVATGRTAGELSDVLGKPVSVAATRRVAQSLAADELTPAEAAARQGELGPEAMLLDVGRQLKGRAEAIAAQPGRGQNTILNAVEQRTGRFGEGTAARVQATLDQNMGPTQNVVDLTNRVKEAVDRIATPLYQKVMADHDVVNVPGSITDRPVVAQAMKDAVTLAKNYNETLSTSEPKTIIAGPGYHIAEDVTTPGKTSLQYWDYVKKALDQRINGYYKSGGATELSSREKADLGGLQDARSALVNHLDDVTGGAYKEARQASATKFELRDALDFGRSAFNTKLLPEEFASSLSDMSVPERAMAQAGFRRELDRIIEATRNEGATARRLLDTNHVLQKAEMLFGPDAARAIEARVGSENTFQEATQDIARNSRTAVRQQLIKDTATPSTAEVRGISIPGLAWAGGRGALNYLRANGMETTRNQIADVLTSRGPDVGPTVEALARLNAARAGNKSPLGRNMLIQALLSDRSQEQ